MKDIKKIHDSIREINERDEIIGQGIRDDSVKEFKF
jgi:hypothetical protein